MIVREVSQAKAEYRSEAGHSARAATKLEIALTTLGCKRY